MTPTQTPLDVENKTTAKCANFHRGSPATPLRPGMCKCAEQWRRERVHITVHRRAQRVNSGTRRRRNTLWKTQTSRWGLQGECETEWRNTRGLRVSYFVWCNAIDDGEATRYSLKEFIDDVDMKTGYTITPTAVTNKSCAVIECCCKWLDEDAVNVCVRLRKMHCKPIGAAVSMRADTRTLKFYRWPH